MSISKYNQTYNYITNGPTKIAIDFNYFDSTGGEISAKPFIEYLKQQHPNKIFNHALDWCSGIGFLGLELFSQQVCKNVTFIDSHMPYIVKLQKNLKKHNITEYAKAYSCDTISFLDKSIRFDLIVFCGPLTDKLNVDKNVEIARINVDVDWKAHKDFFANASQYLETNGYAYVFGHKLNSSPSTFGAMIEDSGLVLNNVFDFLENSYIMEFTKLKT